MARDEIEELALIEMSRKQREMRPATVAPEIWARANERERAAIVQHERLHEIYGALYRV